MLDNFTDVQLQIELDRRRKTKKETEKSRQLVVLDLELLRKVCQNHIDDLAADGYADEDYVHHIYKTAIEIIFGKDIWKWINARLS